MNMYLIFVSVNFLIISTCSVTDGQVPDGVVYTDLQRTVQKGDEVVLRCQFYGAPIAVYWKKGDDPTTSPNLIIWVEGRSPSGSCVNDKSCDIGADYSLTIKSVEVRDRGRYICRVSNYLGILIHNFTDIVVIARPENPYPVIDNCIERAPSNPDKPCYITTKYPTEIKCSVNGYFPAVDLFFLRDLQHVALARSEEVVNDDGTKNKSIVIDAVIGEWTYVCVVSSIPGTSGQRTTQIVVRLEDYSTMLPLTTVSSKERGKHHIITIVAPVSSLLSLVVLLIVIFKCLHWRKTLIIRYDVEKGDEDPLPIIQGKISFYELWILIFSDDADDQHDKMSKLRQTLRNLDVSDVADDLDGPQTYDVFCKWKDGHRRDTQAMDLRGALSSVGLDSEWRGLYAARRQMDVGLSEDEFNHILWQIGDPDRVNNLLGELIPGKRISTAGKMKDIIARAVAVLIEWEGSIQRNSKVLMSLALEKVECNPVDRKFFIVPDALLEEIGKMEIRGFVQRLTDRHLKTLANSYFGTIVKEDLDEYLHASEMTPLFDTQGLILDWISNEECSNFDKRRRLNVAISAAGRQDVEGLFGATILYTQDVTGIKNVQQIPNALIHDFGGISEEEIRRIASYLSPTEMGKLNIGEGPDLVKRVKDWVKSLLKKENTSGGCRKMVHDALKKVECQGLVPFPLKDKTCLVELLELAFRLLMTDIRPFTQALGVSGQRFLKYRNSFTSKQLSNGTLGLLEKISHKVKNKRSDMCSVLAKAGYNNLAVLTKYGHSISLSDMFALGYGPVPTSQERDELRQKLGVAFDHDDIVALLKDWRSMFHLESFNHRIALADAVLPVLGRDKALAVLSGAYRKNGSQSENVVTSLQHGIVFRETCRLAEILKVSISREDDDPLTIILTALEDQLKNGQLTDDVCEKISEVGFQGLSNKIQRGTCQESDNESTRIQWRDSIQNDISARIANVLGGRRTSPISTVFDSWEERMRKNSLTEDKRGELSDRLLRAGYEEFAHEIMTGLILQGLVGIDQTRSGKL
ncbi:uncharacterized protein LOC121419568 [Lytechinus variegatus]|uniref:uncharacterized protein LOC121419568 n=1 Tax=Lytechinus variegatus TaxID=7654 RepID=UPI001BB22016|nr:uncharacterized protein LOC121419568 [Lytechinus variegatus]